MPSSIAQAAAAPVSESKSAKKKKANAARTSEGTNGSSPARVATPDQGTSVAANDANESPYIRELRKIIRNTNKKILNASKTESIIRENSDKSPEQLLAAKIINADQKRQVENKPLLEAELARTEEQLAQVLKLDEEWRDTLASAKAETEKKLADKYEQDKAEAVAELKSKAEADQQQALEDGFLVLSQFLRLAADRRVAAENSTEDSDLAIEGVLLKVYNGDHTAVAAMSKLYHGSDDTTTAIDGTALETTFGQIRKLAVAQAVGPVDESEDTTPEVTASDAVPADEPAPTDSQPPVQTDPTVAYAGLTEIDAGTDVAMASAQPNGIATDSEAPIPNADTGDNAANAAGEGQWDTGNDLAASQEWVEVQKPAEAPQPQTQPAPASIDSVSAPTESAPATSWADEEPSATRTPADANDGFQSVQRNRGRGNGDGFRGGRGGQGGQGRGGRGGNWGRGDGSRTRGRGGRGGAGARRDGGAGKTAE